MNNYTGILLVHTSIGYLHIFHVYSILQKKHEHFPKSSVYFGESP
jgi:hypothetical protein